MGTNKATFFQKILWKFHIKKPNYHLTKEDRALALQLRQKRASLKLLELNVQEIELNKIISNQKLETPEEKLSKVVNVVLDNFLSSGLGKLQKNKNVSAPLEDTHKPAQTQQNELPIYENVQEAEIKQLIQQLGPKELAWCKSKSDEELKLIAQQQLNLSGPNIDKAISLLREH